MPSNQMPIGSISSSQNSFQAVQKPSSFIPQGFNPLQSTNNFQQAPPTGFFKTNQGMNAENTVNLVRRKIHKNH